MWTRQSSDSAPPMRVTSPGDSFGRRVMRTVTIILALVAILLVTIAVIARSDGGRSFAEDRLSKWLGDDVAVSRMYIGWPYVLVMEKVQTRGMADDSGAGCKALEVRITPRASGPWQVTVTRGVLNLLATTDGTWEPVVFAKLGELPAMSVADISRITEPLWGRVSLTLTDGTVRWIGADGVPQASASGVSMSMRPADVPGWRMMHYSLSVYSSMGPGGLRAQDEEREWLASGTREYIELSRSSREEYADELGFWESRK